MNTVKDSALAYARRAKVRYRRQLPRAMPCLKVSTFIGAMRNICRPPLCISLRKKPIDITRCIYNIL